MLEDWPDSPFTKLVLDGRKRTGNFPQNIDLDTVGKNLKRLLPMTFFNLEQNKEVEYYVDIAKGFKYVKRFDLDNPELSKPIYQVHADVYDGYDGETKVTDTLIFVSLKDETDIINVYKIIDDLLTPETYKYRKKSLIRYVLERYVLNNKIIKK